MVAITLPRAQLSCQRFWSYEASAFWSRLLKSVAEQWTPVDVLGLASGMRAIAINRAHTHTLTNADGVKCWADNHYGELGDGKTRDRPNPVDVYGLTSSVVSVSVGNLHS